MKTYHVRKLPHWIPPEAIFFITFRLANSMPASVLLELKAEKERERNAVLTRFSGQEQKRRLYDLEKIYFGNFDAWLDRCLADSPRWLADANVASIVMEEIHHFEGERYHLMAF